MNLALELQLRNLALYTAGNAGLSLAKIAYAARRLFKMPLNRFALVQPNTEPTIRLILEAWGCKVLDLRAEGDAVLSHTDVWR